MKENKKELRFKTSHNMPYIKGNIIHQGHISINRIKGISWHKITDDTNKANKKRRKLNYKKTELMRIRIISTA